MKNINKVMTFTALLLIAGQAVCSARVYDPYAEYGMPEDVISGKKPVRSQATKPTTSKPANPEAYDPYAQYGMPAEAIGLQETRNARKRPARQSSYTQPARQISYEPIDVEIVD